MNADIIIPKGDATDAFDACVIRIKLKTELSLTGATAKFTLLSFEKTFTNAEVLTKVFTFAIPSSKTAGFPLGKVFGKITLYDANSRQMTSSPIPFIVRVAGLKWSGCCGSDAVCEYEAVAGYDYEQSFNKPKINGVEVSGEKPGKDYGLNRICDYDADSTYELNEQVLYTGYFYKCIVKISTPEAWNSQHWQVIGIDEGAANAVHYIEDRGKTEAEKTQARQNIGAASSADLSDHTANRNNPHEVTKSQVGLGNVDNTSDEDKPVSTAQQAAIDLKVAISALKDAVADPSSVKLSPASIKTYLTNLYDAIQAL